VDGQPRVISLKEGLQYYIDFRREVITRRSKYDLKGARERAHILEGLKIALDFIDAVIKTIRESQNADVARRNLMDRFKLSQLQAQAILDMQLRRLASLERQKILDEYEEVKKLIAYLEDLLANPRKILMLVKDDAGELKAKYGGARRTEISGEEARILDEEDLILHQKVVVTLSERGFIKRVSARNYRLQHRGGRGMIGHLTREEDTVSLLTVADTHDYLFFFTNRGRVFRIKCYEIMDDSSRVSKGTAVVNLFPIPEGEKITAMVAVTGLDPNMYLLMGTRRGEVKKTSLDKFSVVRTSGLIATDLEEGDEQVAACLAAEKDEVIMITQKGQSIRFAVSELRASSRTSGGVRGMRLASGDSVVAMVIPKPDAYLLIVSVQGYGKITPVSEYPSHHRAGGGVRTFRITEKKNDRVASARIVSLTQQIMIMTAQGIVIRTPIKEGNWGISILGRNTQGVRLMKPDPGDEIVAVTSFEQNDE
jgi:DNA gyrase subunit A